MPSPASPTKPSERVALVTGRLAEPALRRVAAEINTSASATGHTEVVVLPIQVAALLTTEWVAKKLVFPETSSPITRVILPGYCRGDIAPLEQKFGVPFELGPYSLHDLPDRFGKRGSHTRPFNALEPGMPYDIDIIAEINHAPRLDPELIDSLADAYRADGADVIDIGCDPLPPDANRAPWPDLADTVKRLIGQGHSVSVDTFHPEEARAACAAGARLVLSVNSTNARHAKRWQDHADAPIEVVAVPDTVGTPHPSADLDTLEKTLEQLQRDRIAYRIDPIVEPIGFGFARSLGRYLAARDRFPDAQMMMGVGNLTEMTEADSAGVNAILIGFCQELNIKSVLTTQVIGWARHAVKEIDIARKMIRFAADQGAPPKHLGGGLIVASETKNPRQRDLGQDTLDRLAAELTDPNIRIFAERDELHAMTRGRYVRGPDAFPLFDELEIADPSHAFYLGYEMAKATIALTLGKHYVQDQALRFGHLTRPEISHHERRRQQKRSKK